MASKIEGNVWLGLDVGTQSVRAVAVSDTGRVLGKCSHPLVSRRDGPRHEQGPEDWWHAVVYASRTVFNTLPTSAIRGVAVDGTSGTIVLVDKSGHAITTGVMYDDTRAMDEALLVDEVGAATWAALGYHVQPSWALPKLLWLLRQHCGLIPAVRLAHQADFINRRLAGHEIPSDSSNALKTGYDLVHETWPYEVLEALAVPRQIMPTVVHPGTQVGTICAQAAGDRNSRRNTNYCGDD